MTTNTFEALGVSAPLVRALTDIGLTTPTPIQAQAIPAQLSGRDILGIAQTGTGKTASFALPILQKLTASYRPAAPRCCHALVLSPTRELAVQIRDAFQSYAGKNHISTALVLGGVPRNKQIRAMQRGVDVLIATPGRLRDLMEEGKVYLNETRFLVLDEADRMLDMGFAPHVMKLVRTLPEERQSMLYSATMPQTVAGLCAKILKDPVRIEITPQAPTVDRIEQSLRFVPQRMKRGVLAELFADPAFSRVVVFARTKHGANKVAENLVKDGISADAIHGNKSQNARQRALRAFKAGDVRALVATDIVARGIDVDGVTHVINYELPDEPESYVHRIGRTARAGRSGIAISLVGGDERDKLRAIQRLIRKDIPVVGEVSATDWEPRTDPAEKKTAHRKGGRPADARGNGRGDRQRSDQRADQRDGRRQGEGRRPGRRDEAPRRFDPRDDADAAPTAVDARATDRTDDAPVRSDRRDGPARNRPPRRKQGEASGQKHARHHGDKAAQRDSQREGRGDARRDARTEGRRDDRRNDRRDDQQRGQGEARPHGKRDGQKFSEKSGPRASGPKTSGQKSFGQKSFGQKSSGQKSSDQKSSGQKFGAGPKPGRRPARKPGAGRPHANDGSAPMRRRRPATAASAD